MSTQEIILLVVALIPVVGNLLALVFRRLGWFGAADWTVKLTPLALVAASSKTREEAIRRTLEEVMKLGDEGTMRAKLAALEVATEEKPPSASRLPPMPIFALALLCSCVPILGCGASRAEVRDGVQTYGVPAAQISGAVCDRIAAATGEEWVDFACTIVKGAASVLGNLDSGGGVTIDKPDGPPVKITVRVRAEDADAFEAQHKGAP